MSRVQPEQGKQPAEQSKAALGRTLDTPHLRSMLSTDELRRRPSRPPDHAAENQALIALAQEMAASPEGILQRLADTALSLCRAHSAGLSLLEDADQKPAADVLRMRFGIRSFRHHPACSGDRRRTQEARNPKRAGMRPTLAVE